MKIIFDVGCNIGQNFDYFAKKSDLIIGIEANTDLFLELNCKYKSLIENNKLILINSLISNDEKLNNFYKNKKNSVLSTIVPPKNFDNWEVVELKSEKLSSIIKTYLKIYNLDNIEYIKIDVERYDFNILCDIFKNNIFPKFLSVECHDFRVPLYIHYLKIYQSFKFLSFGTVKTLKDLSCLSKEGNQFSYSFTRHSSGPYGDDIPGGYYNRDSIIPYFIQNDLGWKDIHCSLEVKNYNEDITFDFLKN
jgi:FkbM family methyltransferase